MTDGALVELLPVDNSCDNESRDLDIEHVKTDANSCSGGSNLDLHPAHRTCNSAGNSPSKATLTNRGSTASNGRAVRFTQSCSTIPGLDQARCDTSVISFTYSTRQQRLGQPVSVQVDVRPVNELKKRRWAGTEVIGQNSCALSLTSRSRGSRGSQTEGMMKRAMTKPAISLPSSFNRIPSMIFRSSCKNEEVNRVDVVECEPYHDTKAPEDEITPAPFCESEPEEDSCPICLDELDPDECLATNCNHRFHTQCLLEYLRLRNRYNCPLCTCDITNVNFPGGELLSQEELKEKFYAPAWDIKFKHKSDYDLSFFKDSDEVRPLHLTVGFGEEGNILQMTTLPAIVVQLVDSLGRECMLQGNEDVEIVADHAGADVQLYNATAKVQSDGTTCFSNLVLHIRPDIWVPDDRVFALRFKVVCLGQSEEEALPCHEKEVFGGVRFPLDLRDIRSGIQADEGQPPRSKPKKAAAAPAGNPAIKRRQNGANTNSSSSNANSRGSPGKGPNKVSQDSCSGCTIS
ncbi:hypothetical protein DIPPA_19396 [Diplonema papillatum]|nr:hypothetical protein DIPPA_19396 [Diplonema papillatum]